MFSSGDQMRLFFSNRKPADYLEETKESVLWRSFSTIISQVGDFDCFLQESCEIIHDLDSYDLIWLGLWEDEKKLLIPRAIASSSPQYDQVPLLSVNNLHSLLTPEREALLKAQPILASVSQMKKKNREWAELLSQLGLQTVVCFPLVYQQKIYGLINLYSSEEKKFHDNEFSVLAGVADLLAFKIHAHQEESERKRLELEVELQAQKLRKTMEMTIQALAVTIEMRDPYTAGHQRRVAQLASRIAQEMRLEEEQILNVRLAGIIHDIGKIYIPVEILTKPGRLNDYEISMIRSHPRFGFDIIKETDLPKKIGDIIIQHHERMDGSGYPLGLAGEEIHLESRILSVADVVEAMSSHRPYRPALGLEAALEEINQHKEFLFDPDVVDICLDLFAEQKFCWTREETISSLTN